MKFPSVSNSLSEKLYSATLNAKRSCTCAWNYANINTHENDNWFSEHFRTGEILLSQHYKSRHQDSKIFCVAVHAFAVWWFVGHRKYPILHTHKVGQSGFAACARALLQICCSQSLQGSSLRGRRLKGKRKGALGKGVLSTRKLHFWLRFNKQNKNCESAAHVLADFFPVGCTTSLTLSNWIGMATWSSRLWFRRKNPYGGTVVTEL